MRYRCKGHGCLCEEFVNELNALSEQDQETMAERFHVLTCQRKSELLLYCACGHKAWEHADTFVEEARAPIVEASDNAWHAILAHGDPSLAAHAELLRGELTVDEAYELLDGSRPAMLAQLSRAGVAALKARQGIANALAKARRVAAEVAARSDARARLQESGRKAEAQHCVEVDESRTRSDVL